MFWLILEKYSPSEYYRGFKFMYKNPCAVIIRYPYQYESEEFVAKVLDFIVNDLSNCKFELAPISNVFYLDIVCDKLQYIDPPTFKDNKRRYLKLIKTEQKAKTIY